MSNLLFGATSVTIGALYLFLTVQVLLELRSSEQGPLAYGFIGAFTTCAMHHLLHGNHLLTSETAANLPEGIAMLASAVPAAAYAKLRFNAMTGRHADYEIDGVSTSTLGLMAAGIAFSGGFATWVVLRAANRTDPLDPWALWPGLIMFVAYMVVAWLLTLTQIQRYRTEGFISTSAVTFTVIFFTCALSHYAYAFGQTQADWHMAVADTLGVAGALSFATIVVWLRRSLHRRFASLVGGARVRDVKIVPPWVGTPR